MKENTSVKHSCWVLFWSMLVISAFTFGGGYVIIGMMKKKFTDQLHWIPEDEVLNMTAIAQSAPGALAVNAAVIFGYRLAGCAGCFLSVLGVIIPPLAIISVISVIYQAFSTNVAVQTALWVMRAGVAAVVVDVVIDLAKGVLKGRDQVNIILMLASFAAAAFLNISAIQIVLIFLALGILRELLRI